MNTKTKSFNNKHSAYPLTWLKVRQWINRAKKLHGDPHYVAMGMAIGVFVAATPTMPFQTAIALSLAFVLRSSKAAAAIGVWLSNPITFPVFYLASYKVGTFLFRIHDPGGEPADLLKMGLDITIATTTGGIILGFFPAIAAYVITRKIVTKIRSHEKLPHKKVCESRLSS